MKPMIEIMITKGRIEKAGGVSYYNSRFIMDPIFNKDREY